jgi:hypothetical protein
VAFIPDKPRLSFVPDKAPEAVPGDIDSANAGATLSTAAPDAISTANAKTAAEEHSPVRDVIDMIRAAPEGVIPALRGIASSLTDPYGTVASLAHGIRSIVSNPDAALSTVKNATPEQVGKNVLAPTLVGAGVNELGGAAAGLGDGTSAAAAEAATPAGQLGLRSTTGRPIATTLAGPTAAPTLDAQNQAVAHTVLGADVGVPHGTPVTPASLEAARGVPGKVLDEGAASLPTAPLSDNAIAGVKAARGPATITKPTPNVATQIDGIENALLEPGAQFSGDQIRATRNSLSSDASAGMNSADADTRAIAKYKRGIVDALDQHVADTLPPNSAISPEMIANARATLAKSYNIQDLIGKGGDINLQGLAKLHRDSPGLLTGNTRTVAEFANQHPEVTGGIGDAERIAPPSLATDLAHVNILNPRSWVQPLFGAAGRSSLTGCAPLGLAEQAPVAGSAGEFEHRPMTLAPPPGRAFEPHQLALATGAPTQPDFFGTGANGLSLGDALGGPAPATGGDISLADLLSHGVEQPAAPGLSAGPMGAPQGEGIPFKVNADHAAGGLSLAHEPTLAELLEDLRDHPDVMSQGVPEGIMTRTQNNASGESSASLEAINRDRREQALGQDRFLVDQDGKMWPIRGVDAADATAPKGSIIVQKGIGGEPYSILDRGGLPRANAHGLLNRALAGGHGMNLGDLLGGS